MNTRGSSQKSPATAVRSSYDSRLIFRILLIFFALLYTFHLSVNGYANEYYSSASLAGANSWKAFLFGTSDFPATITVDKPPAALWLPSLFIRVMGLSSWSILLPEVLMLLLSIRLIYQQIAVNFGTLSAWLASFLFASTPLVFVMFRYNNPEALMVLLMIAMAYATDRAMGKEPIVDVYADPVIPAAVSSVTEQKTIPAHQQINIERKVQRSNDTPIVGRHAVQRKEKDLVHQKPSQRFSSDGSGKKKNLKTAIFQRVRDKNTHCDDIGDIGILIEKLQANDDSAIKRSGVQNLKRNGIKKATIGVLATRLPRTQQRVIGRANNKNNKNNTAAMTGVTDIAQPTSSESVGVESSISPRVSSASETRTVPEKYHCYRWLFIVGVCAGLAFLTKQLEALMSFPAVLITIIFFLPLIWWKKIFGFVAVLFGIFCGGGWWVAMVELIPPNRRPYIGGSPTNDFLELTFGYNGLGRILGTLFQRFEFDVEQWSKSYGESANFGYGGVHLSKTNPGISRFFYSSEVGQISWLLGVSVVGIGFFSWLFLIRKIGTRRQKALIVNWALTLMTIFPIFSVMGVAFHVYYPVIMAPAITIIAGIFLGYLWHTRQNIVVKVVSIGTLVILGGQYFVIMRIIFGHEHNILRYSSWILLAIFAVAGIIMMMYWFFPRNLLAYLGALCVFFATALGPMTYLAVSIPVPQLSGLPAAGQKSFVAKEVLTSDDMDQTRDKIIKQLKIDGNRFLWVATIVGSESSYFQLRSGFSVLPIGGFAGVDNNVSLSTLKNYIYDRKIHYFIVPIRNYDDLFPNNAPLIQYVQNNFIRQTYGNDPAYLYYLYDLTKHRQV